MRRSTFPLLGILGLILSLNAGCGGEDPLAMFDRGQNDPVLSLPFDKSDVQGAPTVDPFRSGSNNGFTFRLPSSINQIEVIAPASGVIIDVSGNDSVVIYHNRRVRSRITKITSVRVREGDKVKRNTKIGLAEQTSSFDARIQFSVIVDETPVCPSSYLTNDALDTLTRSYLQGIQLCQS